MAASDSSGTAAKVKYNLSDYLQWEMFYNIVTDSAKGHDIWDGKSEDPTAHTKPTCPQPASGTTEVSSIVVKEYVQSLREFDRMKAALRSLKNSIDPSSSVHVQNNDSIREILQAPKKDYAKSDAELKVELDREFVKLKRFSHSKDIETWVAQWNQFHSKATKYKREEYLGYNTVITFLRASQPVALTFAITSYDKIVDPF